MRLFRFLRAFLLPQIAVTASMAVANEGSSMARGKGIRRRKCHCKACGVTFLSSREDATTCSAKCRKARNRLLGGKIKAVTDLSNASGVSVTNAEVTNG